jgi:tripartite-type tricarboxylate transporter receptor subunit TctC
MKFGRRQFLSLAAGAAALPAVSPIARAQAYPSRPITIVVPYPPGGATDVIARNLAERMKTFLGQPVIIENVTGAGGTIAVGASHAQRPTVTRSAWAKTRRTSRAARLIRSAMIC